LLKTLSPVELTAVAIAKEAQTSSATFYMYFDDVKDLFFSLSVDAGNKVVEALESLTFDPGEEAFEQAAERLVVTFNKVWHEHRPVLRYRNMEADSGDANFDKLRLNTYRREIDVLCKWVKANKKGGVGPTTGDAYALAVVIHAALERLASVDPTIVENGIGINRMIAALARVFAQVMADTPKWGKLSI
jgi:AcrR family transcriptional regulator